MDGWMDGWMLCFHAMRTKHRQSYAVRFLYSLVAWFLGCLVCWMVRWLGRFGAWLVGRLVGTPLMDAWFVGRKPSINSIGDKHRVVWLGCLVCWLLGGLPTLFLTLLPLVGALVASACLVCWSLGWWDGLFGWVDGWMDAL